MSQELEHKEKKPKETFHHSIEEQKTKETEKPGKLLMVLGAMLVLTILVQAFNFMQQSQINSQLEKQSTILSLGGTSTGTSTATGALDKSTWTENEKMNYEMHGTIPARARGSAAVSSTTSASASFSEVAPKGVPRIYGNELGISYDDVSPNNQQKANATIAVLSAFDQENSGKFITLTGEEEQRYIKIASQISCEYCCGAESIIFPNGQRACGCAHSYSMRGLAKYLLQNHPNDFSDDQILEELGKWKTLYFPGVLAQKAQALKAKGIEFDYINLASNKYRGIEKGTQQSGGPMVGGC